MDRTIKLTPLLGIVVLAGGFFLTLSLLFLLHGLVEKKEDVPFEKEPSSSESLIIDAPGYDSNQSEERMESQSIEEFEMDDFIAEDIAPSSSSDYIEPIALPSLHFEPYSSFILLDQSPKGRDNLKALLDLKELLLPFEDQSILIQGHAASMKWFDPILREQEEQEELVPLSYARAMEVKKALEKQGLSSFRFIVQGLGGKKPVVPHSDEENRWMNRRVEVYLESDS